MSAVGAIPGFATLDEPPPTFRDAAVETAYRDDGVVSFGVLDADEVARLLDLYWAEIATPDDPPLAIDYDRVDRSKMARVREAALPIVAAHLDEHFVGHRAVFASFVAKHPSPHSNMAWHEDQTWVDERIHRSGTLWIALTDSGPMLDNGSLEVVAGSHRLARHWCGSGTPRPPAAYTEQLERYAQQVTVPAGTAVYYDSRTYHASAPNRSDAPRVALALTIVPATADLVHVVADGPTRRHLHAVDEQYYVRFPPTVAKDAMPNGYPVLEELDDATTFDASLLEVELGPAPAPAPAPESAHEPTTPPADPTRRGVTVPIRERLRVALERARDMEPAHEVDLPRNVRRLRTAQSFAVMSLLELNDHLIGRFQPNTPARWDTARWPWIASVERAVPTIREELLRYVEAAPIPLVAEVAGFDPDSDGARTAVPVGTGAWRSVILFANGQWIDETSKHFPATRACFETLHPKANVGFSALDGNSHITAHVGANRGALRLQVPIIVPGDEGQCRIRIGDEMVHWKEAEALVFDLKVDHEAWNDTDQLRVLLMVEIAQPLPVPLNWVNRAAQHSMRWHPSYRSLNDRVDDLGRRHDHLVGR